jgi:hypothetical protein
VFRNTGLLWNRCVIAALIVFGCCCCKMCEEEVDDANVAPVFVCSYNSVAASRACTT